MTKVLLYSGGMDSWLIDKIWKPDVKLYVDMNTKYSKEEIKKLPDDVIIEKLDLGKWERADSIIPLRNLYLVMVATNYGDDICLGATAGDRVLDKSFTFGNKASDLLSYLYEPQHWTPGKEINVNLEFKAMTKTELLAQYIQEGGDISDAFYNSFSCYDPTLDNECWKCKPCFRKYVAFKQNGFSFPPDIDKTMKTALETDVIPFIKAGTYGRGEDEEREIMEVYNDLLLGK